MAGQSEHSPDLHFIAGDVLYPQIIDSATGALKPWQEGVTGELLLTHLVRECQPLVRFRTGDIITLSGTGRTAGGVTAPRFRVVGRADDMVVVRGLNMFPAMVQGVIHQFRELSGEYRIVLASPPPHDVLPMEVELAEAGSAEGLRAAIEGAIKRQLGATAKVTLLPPLSIPRSEGKTRRVSRQY